MMPVLEAIKPGHKVRLRDIDPADTSGLTREKAVTEYEQLLYQKLPEIQELLYASACNSVLVVLQGIDTAGKDGTIGHVMSHLNPAGCRVDSFKVPTLEERGHDFLWRAHKAAPRLGWIEIFNRSHYEDVLITRVEELIPKEVWKERYDDINRFEDLLVRTGTIVIKFFLYISKEEQRARLQEREDNKAKAWKLSPSDWITYGKYDDYLEAYQDVLERCSTDDAPWYVIPSNHKWFRNFAVAQTLADVLGSYEEKWRKTLEARGERILKELKAIQTGERTHARLFGDRRNGVR